MPSMPRVTRVSAVSGLRRAALSAVSRVSPLSPCVALRRGSVRARTDPAIQTAVDSQLSVDRVTATLSLDISVNSWCRPTVRRGGVA